MHCTYFQINASLFFLYFIYLLNFSGLCICYYLLYLFNVFFIDSFKYFSTAGFWKIGFWISSVWYFEFAIGNFWCSLSDPERLSNWGCLTFKYSNWFFEGTVESIFDKTSSFLFIFWVTSSIILNMYLFLCLFYSYGIIALLLVGLTFGKFFYLSRYFRIFL